MTTERVPLASLVEDPQNAREHSRRNLDTIKASLRRFGQMKNIVIDKDGIVRAGNGTIVAMRELFTEGDARFEYVTVHRSTLDAEQLAAFGIVDNRSAELAEWDLPMLSQNLRALADAGFPLADIGWLEHETAPLLGADWKPVEQGEVDESHRANVVVFTDEQMVVVKEAVDRMYPEGTDEVGAALVKILNAWMKVPA